MNPHVKRSTHNGVGGGFDSTPPRRLRWALEGKPRRWSDAREAEGEPKFVPRRPHAGRFETALRSRAHGRKQWPLNGWTSMPVLTR
jgi:hypothetical protein